MGGRIEWNTHKTPKPLVRHPKEEYEWVLEQVARVRKDLERETVDVAVSLFDDPDSSLDNTVKDVTNLKYDKNAKEKKRELDELLEELIDLRLRRSEESWLDFEGRSAKLAKKYLDTGWMHSPWLSSFVATNLLDASLSPVFPPDWRFTTQRDLSSSVRDARWVKPRHRLSRRLWRVVSAGIGVLLIGGLALLIAALAITVYSRAYEELLSRAFIGDLWSNPFLWTGLLMIFLSLCCAAPIILYEEWRWYRTKDQRLIRDIRDEVASRLYDSEEITRRLRKMEEKGIYVHSLTYALLRLQLSSPAGR